MIWRSTTANGWSSRARQRAATLPGPCCTWPTTINCRSTSASARCCWDGIETIRRTSIRFHRDEDHDARQELEAILRTLSAEQAVQVVRAFSYFSHLANIAEDRHHIRRRAAHKMEEHDRPGSLGW